MNATPSPIRPLPGRECGTCTVCCVELAIDDPELRKPDGVDCPHRVAHGCGVYARRPRTCAGWFCGWRLLSLSDAMRLDRSGVLLVPEMGHAAGYQKGGLRLAPVGDDGEAVLQDEIVDLAGRCIASGVPIFLSCGSGDHAKRLLVNDLTGPAIRVGDRAAFVALVRRILQDMAGQVAAERQGGLEAPTPATSSTRSSAPGSR